MAARRLTFRVLLVSTHRWLGLLLGLWLALLGATGSLLAWAPELIRAEMLARDPYHRSRVDQPMIGVTAAHAALQRAQPELAPAEIGLVIVPNYRYPHYLFPVRRHGGVVYKVDPYDGTVHRPYRKSDLLIGRVTEWHENLLLGPRGLLLNGLGSALALVMLVSGLWLWWPATWRAARRSLSVRGGQALPRLLLAWHNLLGVASLALVTLVTATAVVLTADTLTRGGVARLLGEAAEPRGRQLDPAPRLPLDTLVARASTHAAGLPLNHLEPGFGKGPSFRAVFQAPTGLLRQIEVTLDPATGELLQRLPASQAPLGTRLLALTRDLHLGVFGGLTSKLLYTVAGLAPLGLWVTGLWLWLRRWWRRRGADQRARWF